MKTSSLSKQIKESKKTTTGSFVAVRQREISRAKGEAVLEATRENFLRNVTRARSCLRTLEVGVLAGPVARNR